MRWSGGRRDATGAGAMSGVHAVKRDLLTIRRIVWPAGALNALLRPDRLITDETRMYLRVQDHTIQIVDLVETYRDIASGITEVYLSSVSQHTNEIMKVLTIIATIFIPLTFIVGVYGMNFDPASPLNMPELRWYYGYPLLWLLMLLIATAMLLLFRRMAGWAEARRTARRMSRRLRKARHLSVGLQQSAIPDSKECGNYNKAVHRLP